MKILLTGATGYLGSRLAHRFVRDGHDVAIVRRPSSDLRRLEEVIDRLQIFVVDEGALPDSLARWGPADAVVHAATLYGRKGETPAAIMAANVLFPLRILEFAATQGTKVVLNADSYFSSHPEHDYLVAYALTKRQFAEWGTHYSAARSLRFVNVPIEHVFGPGDDPAKFVNWLGRECVTSTGPIRLTAGEQRRDFVFIDDVVSAFAVLVTQADRLPADVATVEVGRGVALSLRNFVEQLHHLAGSRAVLQFGAMPYRRGEIMHSCADTTVLHSLGWTPKVDLESGLRQILAAEAVQAS
jgi:nucleoside-diphosphate-sugar epimerase